MKPKPTMFTRTKQLRKVSAVVLGILSAGALVNTGQAQSADALLNKLVEKGILSPKEAEDLRHDSDNGFNKAIQSKFGFPDWVKSVKLYGDFRGRFEEQTAESDQYVARPRYRYRMRLGLTVNMPDNFEVGVRFASGNPLTSAAGTLVGGSTVTANQDLHSLDSRKFLWIDAAYAKWSPIKNDDWTVTGVLGKFDNPFQLSNMIFDYDLVPEGAGLMVNYNINKQHSLRAIGAVNVLDEFNQSYPANKLPAGVAAHPSHDPYLIGGQFLWDAHWTERLDSTLGVAAFNLDSKDSLSALVQPFYNSGNTRNANGFLVNNYNPIIGSAAATYTFDPIPIYPGKFPVKLAGEILENPAASSKNHAWRGGVTLGKSGKKGTWEINYRYQRLEADAWFDAMVDDDNGAFYEKGNPQLTGTGKSNGWFGGTNVKGHQIVGIYSFTDFLNLTFTYYNNELIAKAHGEETAAQHFMVDLNWRF